ncbi:hypothetical protein HC256_004357 [Beauveria bassiana]|nr:hypothetical protein HC256_004357 [Beauveria bassiana]
MSGRSRFVAGTGCKMLRQIPMLKDQGLSAEFGLLPHEPPLVLLSDPCYNAWETAVVNLPAFGAARHNDPELITSCLCTCAERLTDLTYYIACMRVATGYILSLDPAMPCR